MDYYFEMLAEKERLEKEIAEFTKLLAGMPEGELRIHRSGKHYRWYRRMPEAKGKKTQNSVRKSIPKSDRELAEQLALKGYYEHSITDAKREIAAINKYLLHHDATGGWAQRYMSKNEGIGELLSSYFAIENESLAEWAKQNYVKYSGYPEQLTVPTVANHYVRSKSEGMITNVLVTKRIPYHYEEILYINGMPIYPDFVIKHPLSGKLYVWEHLGMVDDHEYLTKNMQKVIKYIEAGYIPGVNLILTYETKNNPLDIRYVNALVEYFFG